MPLSLLTIEDFASDALDVRNAVIAGGFKTETGPDGLEYTGISVHPVPHWYESIARFLGRPISVKLSCFRLNLAGEKPHSWVHSDGICDARWASVLYLNLPDQCQGGTAFWRHAALKMHQLPSEAELRAAGHEPEWFYGMMQREWQDLRWWELYQLIGMRFNRFVMYPTAWFHSRYPFGAFGSGPEDGRLVWALFFD